MFRYILKRILIAIPVLIGITILDFAIMNLAGSPLEMMLGPKTTEAALEAKAIQLGLDKPIYVQYFVWLKNVLQGNLGYSIKSYQPVSKLIGDHLGPTLLLMGTSLLPVQISVMSEVLFWKSYRRNMFVLQNLKESDGF